MTKTIDADTISSDFTGFLRRFSKSAPDVYVVLDNGHARAALIDLDLLEDYLDSTNTRLLKKLRLGNQAISQGKGITPAQL